MRTMTSLCGALVICLSACGAPSSMGDSTSDPSPQEESTQRNVEPHNGDVSTSSPVAEENPTPTLSATPAELGTRILLEVRLDALGELLDSYISDDDSLSEGEQSADLDLETALSRTESQFAEILTTSDEWLVLSEAIDYEAVDLSVLEPRVEAFNQGLRSWLGEQETQLATWNDCIEQTDTDEMAATCWLTWILEQPDLFLGDAPASETYARPLSRLQKALESE